ncbi:unnamed protein product (macronuclear) [Paramecium tetraurelia]|uniref:Uncharacterized protein n=1 Tax=Paramecium tetraurelia TaxID=5888 RepID=A0DHI4_PARTE|nr:uncharacterized protein GSPATT00016888001 [Paramecium tetraurelia]CAK82501.1 unnamed protein product [Paramecium tetraurelia]|eukprot:XP_001449898.1 hypothetical protein (macronuclear) [Paramecium tetraurelia strain d4-2]
MSIKLYGPSTNPRLNQVQLVADLLQIPVEQVEVGYHECESKEHLARNPFARIPVIETTDGFLYESNAICRYLARSKLESGLYGATPFQQSQVDQWIDWTINELDPNFMTTFPQLWGHYPANEDTFKTAKNIINDKLKQLEGHFKNSPYLVGDKLTIADVTLIVRIAPFFILLIDEKTRKSYPSLMKWFTAVSELPQFKKNFGRVRLCKVAFPLPKQEAQPKEEKAKEQKPKDEKPKEQKPKDEKPKEQKQKEQKPKEAEKPKEAQKQKAQEDDEPLPEKKKNPLDLLPPSPFNIDDYKRAFFAEKDIAKNIQQLFTSVDVQGWSLWIVTYNKSQNEGKQLILTNNLMKGFINQRLDQNFRKYSFAIHGVYGDEPNLEIRGAWIWRGTEVPQEWKDHVAYDYHVFRRIDINNEQDKKDFTEYWVNQEEDESKVGGLTARSLTYFR